MGHGSGCMQLSKDGTVAKGRDPRRTMEDRQGLAEGRAGLAQHPGQLPSLSRRPWTPN